MRLIARLSILAVAALAAAGPALAGQPVSLKADTVNASGMVTLGDLFDGAGAAARVALAPRPGANVILDAATVQAVARRAGLDWDNPNALRKILVRGVAAGAPSATNAGTPAAAVAAAHGNVEILTYARSLSAGDIVQPTDLIWAKAAAAPNDAPSDADQVIGKVAKRPVREGAAVAARDVGAPLVVKAGETITVAYEADGISLTLEGKALTTGGVGETINVLNPVSKKTIQAVVTGPGQALVGPGADQLKAAHPARYAAR